MTTIYEVLRRPIITEKTNYQTRATKAMVKDAVETLFDVKVDRVNVINVPAKRTRRARSRRLMVRRSGYKKAIVTLPPGESIDIFEGVK